MTAPPITQKHLFGWKMEQLLRPYFEEVCGEELTPTTYRFDGCDLIGETFAVESKARPKYAIKSGKYQDMASYPTWVIPTCKVDKHTSDKRLIFFYYWEANQKLFFLEYDQELFDTFLRGVPYWTSQEHFFIPAEVWVECADIN
jgi:hypothetical protein